MKKYNKAHRAICATLVSALTIGGTTLAIAPEFAYAETLVAQAEGIEASVITFSDTAVSIPEGETNCTAKGTDVTISAAGT